MLCCAVSCVVPTVIGYAAVCMGLQLHAWAATPPPLPPSPPNACAMCSLMLQCRANVHHVMHLQSCMHSCMSHPFYAQIDVQWVAMALEVQSAQSASSGVQADSSYMAEFKLLQHTPCVNRRAGSNLPEQTLHFF